jgi:hypothetical protein
VRPGQRKPTIRLAGVRVFEEKHFDTGGLFLGFAA